MSVGRLLPAFFWCVLGGGAVAAGTAHAAAAPPVVIQAAKGSPAHLATYQGPGGTPIPIGACAAVLHGRTWVLPCSDGRVRAYRRAAAAAHRTRESAAAAVLSLATIGACAAEFVHRRRVLVRQEG